MSTVLARIDDLLHVGPISADVRAVHEFLTGGAVPDEETVSRALGELRDVSLQEALFVVGEAEFARRGAPNALGVSLISVPGATETAVFVDPVAQEAQVFGAAPVQVPAVAYEEVAMPAFAPDPATSEWLKQYTFTNGEDEVIGEADRFAGQLVEADIAPADLVALASSYVAEATRQESEQVAVATQENV